MRDKLKNTIAEYGYIAMGVWVGTFALVYLAVLAAIQLGFEFESTEANAGTFLAAYGITRLTFPVRVASTLALTPIVATVLGRKKKVAPDDAQV